jgi:hypothetical protein
MREDRHENAGIVFETCVRGVESYQIILGD